MPCFRRSARRVNIIGTFLVTVLAVLLTVQAGARSSVSASAPSAPRFDHVLVVMEENHSYSSVIGSSAMPYLNGLASQYGLATNYFADTHPSIGNYFMLTAGQIITNDDSFTGVVSQDNIVRELQGAGLTWKSYAESLPSVGYTGGDVYPYFRHHNPFSYFSDVLNNSTQANNLVPFTQFAADLSNGQLPSYSYIIPNVNDDAHDCPAGLSSCTDADKLAAADNWLRNNIGPLISSAGFQQSGLLVIVFDESVDSDTTNGGGQIAMVAISSRSNPGFRSTTFYQHESTLRLTAEALGLTTIPGAGATAPEMGEFFNAGSSATLLADDFNGSQLDSTKWIAGNLFSGTTDPAVATQVAGQQLQIGPLFQHTTGSHYNGIRSVNSYNFTGASAAVQFGRTPAAATAADAMFTIGGDVNNYYRFYVESGNLIAQKRVGGAAKAILATVAYDPVNDSFLRIRHDAAGSNVVFEVAPNNNGVAGTWKTLYTEPWSSSIPLSSILFELKGGTWQSEASAPGSVVFDNFLAATTSSAPPPPPPPNPAPSVTAISPNSGSANAGTSVTLTGSNFLAGAKLTIGGTAAANISVNSSSSISGVTPALPAGVYDVVVTNTDGQSGTLAGGYTSTAPPPNPGPSTLLADNFAGSSLDTSKWVAGNLFSGLTDSAVPVNVVNQQLQIGPLDQNTGGSHYNGIRSVNSYNFSGAFAAVQLARPASASTTADAMFTIGSDVNNYYRMYVEAGNLVLLKRAGGTKVTLLTTAYSVTNASFLRIRHDSAGSNVVFEVAPNNGGAPGRWVQLYNELWNSSVTLSAIIFELKGGTWQTEVNPPGTVNFASFNAAANSASPPPPPPPTSKILLADSFSGSSLDTSKWAAGALFSGLTDSSVGVSVASQQLQIGPLDQNTSGSHYNGITSVNSYNFTGAFAWVQLAHSPSASTTADAMFTIGSDVNSYYRMYVEAGNLVLLKRVGGTKVTLLTTAYSATNASFLRIRHDASAGNVVFEVAPNNGGAPGSWTQLYSEPWNSSVALTAIIFELKGGTWQAETNVPGTVSYANFQAATP